MSDKCLFPFFILSLSLSQSLALARVLAASSFSCSALFTLHSALSRMPLFSPFLMEESTMTADLLIYRALPSALERRLLIFPVFAIRSSQPVRTVDISRSVEELAGSLLTSFKFLWTSCCLSLGTYQWWQANFNILLSASRSRT